MDTPTERQHRWRKTVSHRLVVEEVAEGLTAVVVNVDSVAVTEVVSVEVTVAASAAVTVEDSVGDSEVVTEAVRLNCYRESTCAKRDFSGRR